jgi:hypothetical protein
MVRFLVSGACVAALALSARAQVQPNPNNGGSSLSTPVSVINGGTGNSTLGAHGVLLGQGTGVLTAQTPGAPGTVLTSTGASTDPTWQSSTGASLGANVYSGKQSINDATANEYGLVLTPPTLSAGNTGFGQDILGTVNDASAVDGVISFANITCALCTATSYLVDWQVGGVSQFKVSTGGAVTLGGTLATNGTITVPASSGLTFTGRANLGSPAASVMGWGAGNLLANLPNCGSNRGARSAITDPSGTPAWGATAAGTGTAGSTSVPVFCNGVNWVYG